MKTEIKIRHRRLYAFFNSKVINSLMILMELCILIMPLFRDIVFPVVCGGLCLLAILSYSLWLWIINPLRVIISPWLSDLSGTYTVYFLIVVAIKDAGIWWYLFAGVSAILIFLISLINPREEEIEI
ncbi:MAG: hypothetical protein K2G90_08530 [Muribaculaceae bacterium]|nr:hypothetical protein [Muribaculaceae bacterium]